MEEKPQFYVEIWCHDETMINKRIAKYHKLDRIYDDKEDVKGHGTEILSNNADYCKQHGNRKPVLGKIYTEHEYRQKLNERKYMPR